MSSAAMDNLDIGANSSLYVCPSLQRCCPSRAVAAQAYSIYYVVRCDTLLERTYCAFCALLFLAEPLCATIHRRGVPERVGHSA